ncbi:MAG: hypothetical protein ACK4NC_05615 [Candidatus Gracilibacteria bacterium]
MNNEQTKKLTALVDAVALNGCDEHGLGLSSSEFLDLIQSNSEKVVPFLSEDQVKELCKVLKLEFEEYTFLYQAIRDKGRHKDKKTEEDSSNIIQISNIKGITKKELKTMH